MAESSHQPVIDQLLPWQVNLFFLTLPSGTSYGDKSTIGKSMMENNKPLYRPLQYPTIFD